MTVQFTIEAVPTGRFVLAPACLDPGATGTFNGADDYASYEEAFADATAHQVACEDCAEFGCRPQGAFDVPAVAISMSNVDAQVTLARLDLRADADGDVAGVCDGADFHSRVLAALATLTDDTGIRPMVDVTPGLARVVHGGEEAGAIEARLRDLHDLGVEATRLGRDVQWS